MPRKHNTKGRSSSSGRFAEIPDVSPASITYGAPEITSTGATAAQVENDLAAMVQSLIDGGVALAYPHWIMSPENALTYETTDGVNYRLVGS